MEERIIKLSKKFQWIKSESEFMKLESFGGKDADLILSVITNKEFKK